MGASVIDRVEIQYVADASGFEAGSRKAESRFADLSAKFKEGASAKIGAEVASVRQSVEKEGGGGLGAALIASAAAAGTGLASSAGKALQVEMRAAGQSGFDAAKEQISEMGKSTKLLKELVQQKYPDNLENMTKILNAGNGHMRAAQVQLHGGLTKMRTTIDAGLGNVTGKFKAWRRSRFEDRYTQGGTDPIAVARLNWARTNPRHRPDGTFRRRGEVFDSDEAGLRAMLAANEQKYEKIAYYIRSIAAAGKQATAILTPLAKGVSWVFRGARQSIMYLVTGAVRLTGGLTTLGRTVKSVGAGLWRIAKMVPFSALAAGAAYVAPSILSVAKSIFSVQAASFAAKGALGGLLGLPTGVLLMGIWKIKNMLVSYTGVLNKAKKDVGGGKEGGGVLSKVTRSVGLGAAASEGGGKVKSGGGIGLRGMLGIGATAGVLGLVTAGFMSASKEASNYGEATNKAGEVFRSAEGTASSFVDGLAAQFGLAKQAGIETMTTFAGLFEQTGAGSAAIAGMSSQFTQLALDATSFHNVGMDEAMAKMGSALRGETEGIREFGVNVSAEAVQMEGIRKGYIKAGQEMTEGQKIMARASIITRSMSNASGDLARTMDSPANQSRKLQGTLQNLALSVGEQLQPAFEAGIGFCADIVGWLAKKYEENKAVFGTWIGYVREAINMARDMFQRLPEVWEIVQLRAWVAFQNLGKTLWYFWDVSKAVALAVAEDFPGTIKECFWNVIQIAKNLIHNIKGIFTGGWEAITRTISFIFNKLISKIDDLTGGMVSKFMKVKPEKDLAKDWQALQNDFGIKSLADGTETKHFDRIKNAMANVPFPDFVNADDKIRELQDKLQLGLTTDKENKAKKAEEDREAAKRAMASVPKEQLALPKPPEPEAKIKSMDDYARSISEGILGKNDPSKKQTEYQKQMSESLKEQTIIERRREARAKDTVTAT